MVDGWIMGQAQSEHVPRKRQSKRDPSVEKSEVSESESERSSSCQCSPWNVEDWIRINKYVDKLFLLVYDRLLFFVIIVADDVFQMG